MWVGIVIVGLVACGDDGGGASDAAIPADARVDAAPVIDASCSTSFLIFLNRGGGSYTPGSADPGNNITPMISDPVMLDPYTATEQVWNDAVACVQADFAPYRIAITDIDPATAAPHMEVSVVDGNSTVLGIPAGPTSLSPFACSPTLNVAFVFGGAFPQTSARLCREMEFTIAKMFGLDNVVGCGDIASYGECMEATVQDVDKQCGEFSARDCSCTDPPAATQNSHELISAAAGLVCP